MPGLEETCMRPYAQSDQTAYPVTPWHMADCTLQYSLQTSIYAATATLLYNHWFEQSLYAGLGVCRQNQVATINGILPS